MFDLSRTTQLFHSSRLLVASFLHPQRPTALVAPASLQITSSTLRVCISLKMPPAKPTEDGNPADHDACLGWLQDAFEKFVKLEETDVTTSISAEVTNGNSADTADKVVAAGSDAASFKALEEFSIFKRLPREIKLMIWKATFETHPKVVTMSVSFSRPDACPMSAYFKFRDLGVPNAFPKKVPTSALRAAMGEPYLIWLYTQGYRARVRSPAVFPSSLHACKLARMVGTELLTTAFSSEVGHPIYFDFEKDVLHFTSTEAAEIFRLRAQSEVARREAVMVKRLVLTATINNLAETELVKIMGTFPKLTHLYIVSIVPQIPNVALLPDVDGFCSLEDFKPNVMMEFERQGRSFPDWTPPNCKFIDPMKVDVVLSWNHFEHAPFN